MPLLTMLPLLLPPLGTLRMGSSRCPARCTSWMTLQAHSLSFASQDVQQRFMRELLVDALGFGSAVIIRRLVGMAHTVDMDAIQPAETRQASCAHSPNGRKLLHSASFLSNSIPFLLQRAWPCKPHIDPGSCTSWRGTVGRL